MAKLTVAEKASLASQTRHVGTMRGAGRDFQAACAATLYESPTKLTSLASACDLVPPVLLILAAPPLSKTRAPLASLNQPEAQDLMQCRRAR